MRLPRLSTSPGEINPASNITPIPSYLDFSRNEWNFMRTERTSDASQHFSAKQIITFCRQKNSSDVSLPLPLPQTINCGKSKFSFTQIALSVTIKRQVLSSVVFVAPCFHNEYHVPLGQQTFNCAWWFFLGQGRWKTSLRITFVLLWQCCL